MKFRNKTLGCALPIGKIDGPMLTIDLLLDCDCLLHLDSPLTRAEFEVACKFVSGFTYNEIANQRQVSRETIKSQVANVLSKTSRIRRLDLVKYVIEQNLLIWSSTPSMIATQTTDFSATNTWL